ncbi:MAG: DUF1080 domain-containing protein [Bacteroidota bacterium]
MIKQLTGCIFLLAVAACNNNPDSEENVGIDTAKQEIETTMNALTDQEKSEGWQSLFDGNTSNGWHSYGGGVGNGRWKAADGALMLDTTVKVTGGIKSGGNLLTDDEFENFHLKLEWKISKNGNSGILFYVNEDTVKYKEPYYTGPEMQVLDNDGHSDGKIIKHRAGDLYDLISCSKETVKPVGEWNLAEIKCLNGKLDFYLNGENVVSTTMWNDNWNKMVAGSKFKQWKDFATYKKGKICLQDHGNEVSYRNIRIRKL